MKDRYYVRAGDLLHNKHNGIIGLVVSITKTYVHFYLLGIPDHFDDGLERATKSEVYYSIDKGELQIYYGTKRRRRRRPPLA